MPEKFEAGKDAKGDFKEFSRKGDFKKRAGKKGQGGAQSRRGE